MTSAGNLPLMLSPTVLHRRSTILVVDDEESLRLYLARVLEEEGYRVITARDGSSALALIERAGDSVRLVITDVSMPNLSGPELARRMAARPAAPPVLFISGTDSGLNLPGPLLPKPFLPEELTRLVRRMVPAEPLSHGSDRMMEEAGRKALSRDAGAPWRAPSPGRQATS